MELYGYAKWTSYLSAIPYALAKISGEPLLFKGNDFSQTDIPGVFD